MAGEKPDYTKPLRPDDALAAIVGHEPRPRNDIYNRVWDYIRAHNLHDPDNKRHIRADEKLRRVFDGQDWIPMTELARYVYKHTTA